MLVALVGQPNSGKSALLSRLTGARVVTSNYPGTTVELCSGRIRGSSINVLDTPGIYSLGALTQEQRVTKSVLESGSPDLLVNVVDGSNLARHLSLTLSLMRLGFPIIVAVNCIDRLASTGLRVDSSRLESILGASVVLTSAATGEGLPDLLREIRNAAGGRAPQREAQVGPASEPLNLSALHRESAAVAESVLSPIEGRASRPVGLHRLRRALRAPSLEAVLDRPLPALMGLGIALAGIWRLAAWALPSTEAAVRVLLDPAGAYLSSLLEAWLPRSPLSAIVARALTEGLVLPLATVLPAMIFAYSLIAFLEDTGLLARYAAMGDGLTGVVNLPGQALVPFMLGLGCRVPGLLAARTLPSPESRRSASILIAALVPCTATVSLAWATLARFGGNPVVPCVALTVSALLLSRGMGLAQRSPKDPLVLELPPLRLPALGNVIMKTEMRLVGFFTHVMPLVVGLNVGLRLLMPHIGPPDPSSQGLSRAVFGIPPHAFMGVLLTMLQRYLAPLFLMQQDLSPREATIAVTMVVLGFPCLPSAACLWREHGASTVLVTFLASTFLFIGWGGLLNLVLP